MKLSSLKRSAAAMMAVVAGVLVFAGGVVAASSPAFTLDSLKKVSVSTGTLYYTTSGLDVANDTLIQLKYAVRASSTTSMSFDSVWTNGTSITINNPGTLDSVSLTGLDTAAQKLFLAGKKILGTTEGDTTELNVQIGTIPEFVTPPNGKVLGVVANRVAASPGTSVKVDWTALTGATRYKITYNRVDTAKADGTLEVANVRSATVTGLTTGRPYWFLVYPGNSAGFGMTKSDTAYATPGSSVAAPGNISNLTAASGPGKVSLAWNAASNGGGTNSYVVNYYPSGEYSKKKTLTVTTLTASVTGLENMLPYTFDVRAKNNGGQSPDSVSISATPAVPDSVSSDGYITTTYLTLTYPKGDNVPYTPNGKFKYSLPSGTSVIFNVKKKDIIGESGDFKIVSITYKNSADWEKTFAPSSPSANLTFDKGIGVDSTDVNGEEIGFDGIIDTWNVDIVYENTKAGSAGYGLLAKAATTFVIGKRDLSESAIKVTTTLDGGKTAEYDGNEKELVVTVKDGNYDLEEGVHYEVEMPTAEELTSAGTDKEVKITPTSGGPYKGLTVGKYTITKAAANVAGVASGVTFEKAYDGTVVVDTSTIKVDVVFQDKQKGDITVSREADYTVTKLKYNSAGAGTDKEVSFEVVPVSGTDFEKNYTIGTKTYTLKNQKITKAAPANTFFTAKLGSVVLGGEEPVQTVASGTAKTVTVAYAVPEGATTAMTGGAITVKYSKNDSVFTAAPKDIGIYDVLVDTKDHSNIAAATGLKVASFEIIDGLPPIIEEIPDTSYYSGESVTLKVVARNPADTTKLLTSGIQWYEVAEDGTRTKKTAGATQVVNSKVVGILTYQADVTFSTNQVPKTASSNAVKVEIKPERVSLKGATVSVSDQFEYTGSPVTVLDNQVTVTVGTQTLSAGTDFTVTKHSNNLNAGEDAAVVTVTGVGAYKDSEIGTFTITKRAVTVEDLKVATYSVEYNGKEQPIVVGLVKGTGLGVVTATYSPDSLPRVGVGTWNVTVDIEEGGNFLAGEGLVLPQSYKITKVRWDKDMHLTYKQFDTTVVWNGSNWGTVAVPAKKGVATNYTGDLRVVYEANNVEGTTAVGDSSAVTVYTVKVKGPADDNFTMCDETIGTITVLRFGDAILDANREIPVGGVTADQAAVAPVKIITNAFSVGPNPASNNGAVSIYWNGSKSVNGKLAVFTSNGKKIATVPVSGTKKIGSWNAAGAPEGSYLIKGVLTTRDGEKVKVSTLVGVTK